MAKTYKGSLTLDWYNKQKAILLTDSAIAADIPAPTINWVNKDEALFYEVDESEGRGLRPYWVNQDDIRVKEARPLILQGTFKATPTNRAGTLPGTDRVYSVTKSTVEDESIQNILIKGDNLLALNSIRNILRVKGEDSQVKCIFIDPPYNTGKAFAQYDDNLELSQWLTLMRDRLVKLHEILADEGFIWITLDDKGIFHCRVLMDEIFGKDNFVGNVVWQHSVQGKNDAKKLSIHHNYILCYRKNEEGSISKGERLDEHNVNYANPDNDPKGDWRTGDFRSPHYRANLKFALPTPSGKEIIAPENGWRWSLETMQSKIASKEIVFNSDETRITRKIYLKDQEGRVPESIWFESEVNDVPESIWLGKDVGTTRDANNEIKQLFGYGAFETPKPEKLIRKIIQLSTKEGGTILDCFGGSGTTFATAHKMGRNWIGVEVGSHADEVIVARMTKVVSGEDNGGISSLEKWKGGGSFKFYHLGPSIIAFNSKGEADFNWSLGKSFLEESFLSSYDYTLVADTAFLGSDLFADKDTLPKIGVQRIGSKTRVAVVSLNAPDGTQPTISFDELRGLYAALKAKFAPQYINVFTNRGVELAFDSKPDDLEVFKIPHAIFAELEK